MKLVPIALVALTASLSLLVGCSDTAPDPTDVREMTVERYENGQKKFEGHVNAVGQRDGKWTFWYESGHKSSEGSFKNGVTDGSWTVWNQDGSIDTKRSGIYKASVRVAPLSDK